MTEKELQEIDARIAELEAQNQVLTECLMEMSQIVYA